MILAVVVGGQFGSEAKGHVTKQVIAKHRLDEPSRTVVNIRVAGPNAGHCAYDHNGNKYALRTVPMGAVIDDPKVLLYIAPGSEVEPAVLWDELALLESNGIDAAHRLTISPEATILTDEHKVTETGMQERMGSTGKGIGACRADRIMRTAKRVGDDDDLMAELLSRGIQVRTITQDEFPPGTAHAVVIEGTQGYGLGLHAGFYPQCTSSDTRAIDFLAMAGFMPWHPNTAGFMIYVVARVYPIRVAGNSGPLEGETSWEALNLPEEYTTVTKKVRRVGQWNADLIRAAVNANGGAKFTRLALTMVDQKFAHLANMDGTDPALTNTDSLFEALNREDVAEFLINAQEDAGTTIGLITTGEDSAVWF